MLVLRKIYDFFDSRYHVTPALEVNVTKKLVPRTLGWAGCFGGLALFTFLTQVFTGALLLMFYKPDPARAWDSVMFVKSNVSMGWLVQRIHAVGANVMILLVLLHMARVAYYRIFKPPRELHWVSGVVLFFLTTALAFTGYLLPWTQLSFWGAKIGTEIPRAVPGFGPMLVEWARRGKTLGPETLGFFFSLHVWVLPAIISGFMAMHFVMIRRTGISKPL